MKRFFKVLFYTAAVLYPFIIFTFLVILKLPVRVLSLCIMALALAFFLAATGSVKKTGHAGQPFSWRPVLSATLFLAAGILCFFTNQAVFLKLYSVSVSLIFLLIFGSTLFFPPNMIFRFACLQDKTIRGSAREQQTELYCRKVTIAWCLFFILNGSAAVYTALFCSDRIWSVYNGGISYILMGLMFAVEYIIRRKVEKKMLKTYPFSQFKADSRSDDYIMCYEDTWSKGGYKTWHDFLTDTAKMRAIISTKKYDSWILHCDDYWYFLVTFAALLQCRKQILLTQNTAPAFITEMRKPETGFLTDLTDVPDSIYIPHAIEQVPVPSEKEVHTAPQFSADDTRILMFTSGSTGQPKAVKQRMTEFELDNAFIISKWGEEFTKRKLVTTVSQHHIYGFLFGISLPFTLGVPFRRHRIEFPEEFEKLTDESYIIIAVPAFLKRTVEAEQNLHLNKPFIFTSGGVLLPETAAQTDKVFGFWPLEVYGSTETSGIAYRQSKNGLKWTPFDNAKLWLNDEGCIVIKSPYIKDPAGFATADLGEFFPDGTFLLKGRSDSIVKIEEKRISMTEVEKRILETGLVQDVKVVDMNDRRQYLAAVIVFNAEGKKKFAGMEKFYINKFFHDFLLTWFENVVIPKKWRYLETIPCDAQGKKHKLDIQALFAKPDPEKTDAE